MHTVILVITTLSSIATIIAAIIALVKPSMMSRSATITHGEDSTQQCTLLEHCHWGYLR